MKTALSMSIASSRFANCMFLALSSGLDTDRGLDLAQALVNNPVLDSKINDCRKNISNGETFSEALLHSNIFFKDVLKLDCNRQQNRVYGRGHAAYMYIL